MALTEDERRYQREWKRNRRENETPEQREARLKVVRDYYGRTRTTRLAEMAAYREQHREELRAWQREYGQTPVRKAAARARLLARYGLTPEQYAEMYVAQDGCCAICGLWQEVLVVDHDHETNRVRGLLCDGCNLGLGKFGDDPDRLETAATYLREASLGQP